MNLGNKNNWMSGRKQEAVKQYHRHRLYLFKIRSNSLYCPRYDMLSLNNNLLLHRKHDPLNELKPQSQAPHLAALQKQILRKSTKKEEKEQNRAKWFEDVVTREPGQGKFRFTYVSESKPQRSVRQQLSKIYNIPRQSKARGSFSQSLYDIN